MKASAPSANLAFSDGYRRYVLGLLLLVYVVNFLDRSIVNILLEPIKRGVPPVRHRARLPLRHRLRDLLRHARPPDRALGRPRRAPRHHRAGALPVERHDGAVRPGAHVPAARAGAHRCRHRRGRLLAARALDPLRLLSAGAPRHRLRDLRARHPDRHRLRLPARRLDGGGRSAGAHAFLLVGLPGPRCSRGRAPHAARAAARPLRGAPRAARRRPSRRGRRHDVGPRRASGTWPLGATLHAFVGYGVGAWNAAFLVRSHGMSLGEIGAWLALHRHRLRRARHLPRRLPHGSAARRATRAGRCGCPASRP